MQQIKEQLQKFRQEIYDLFIKRPDAIFNLLDALSSDGHQYKSVVELSQSPRFEREYSSITDAITHGLSDLDFKKIQMQVFNHTRATVNRPHLFFTDCTNNPRPYAKVMREREIVHFPNPAPGNKPHQYSLLAMAPQGERSKNGRWLIPLSMQRVGLDEKGNETGVQQVLELIDELGLENELCINTGDSLYGSEACRKKAVAKQNLVQMFRLSNKRKFYRAPGRRKLFGDKVMLSDPQTHPTPDAVQTIKMSTKKGKICEVELTLFKNLLLRGSKDFASQEHPLNVVKAVVKDNDGALVFKRPLWIGIIGARKDELSSEMAYNTYLNRYDIEHFFRFGKQKLLPVTYQTPELKHEEYWWKFVPLAYVQLYLARQLADVLPKPWERYLPEYKDASQKTGLEKTPSQTQRSFANILEMIGTPAKTSVPRGNPKGREFGVKPDKREAHPIHFKSAHQQNDLKKTISRPIENSQEKPNLNEIELILHRLKLEIQSLGLSHVELLISSA